MPEISNEMALEHADAVMRAEVAALDNIRAAQRRYRDPAAVTARKGPNQPVETLQVGDFIRLRERQPGGKLRRDYETTIFRCAGMNPAHTVVLVEDAKGQIWTESVNNVKRVVAGE